MAKITPKEKENIQKLVVTLPKFPFTKKNGEPIKFKFRHTGEYILKHWEEFAWLPQAGIKRKDIQPNNFYNIEKELFRDPANILLKAHKKGRVQEAYEEYIREFETWGKWMVDNNTKIIENKN